MIDIVEDVSKDVTKTRTEISKENDKALAKLNNKLLDILNDWGPLASYLLSPLSEITNQDHASQFKLVKYRDLNRVINRLLIKTVQVIVYDNLLTFRDTDKKNELKGELVKTITNKNYIVDLADLQVKKLMFEFAKKMCFDEKTLA